MLGLNPWEDTGFSGKGFFTFLQLIFSQLDPGGWFLQKYHRLRRRVYRNEGLNAAWHADGNDKSKPYGFAIHGCIDGWSCIRYFGCLSQRGTVILITSHRIFWRLLKNMADAQ